MTAFPNPTDFGPMAKTVTSDLAIRPILSEHYWGYEVSPSRQKFDGVNIMRAVLALFAVLSLCGAIGVWAMPGVAIAQAAFGVKFATSVLLLCVGCVLAKVVARGTQVRVQIDTAHGEIREVVDGPFGAVLVLAQYGFDAVEKVEVATSRTDPTFGQIHVTLNRIGVIPVGDGSIVHLGHLRARLMDDFGLVREGAKLDAVWSGPIAA